MWRSSLWSISWLRHQMFYPYVMISAAQARESDDLHRVMSPFSLFLSSLSCQTVGATWTTAGFSVWMTNETIGDFDPPCFSVMWHQLQTNNRTILNAITKYSQQHVRNKSSYGIEVIHNLTSSSWVLPPTDFSLQLLQITRGPQVILVLCE